MANPSSSRAEAAYARAMAAYQEGSYDLARRLTSDALADDPNHAGARALRARIDARLSPGAGRTTPFPGAGRGMTPPPSRTPEATSVDPTILIDRVSDRRPPEYIEPTVVIRRGETPGGRGGREATPPPSSARTSHPVSEPTVLVAPPPKKKPSRSGSRAGSPGFLALLWLRLKGGDRPAAHRQPTTRPAGPAPSTGFWTPTTRGIVMAVAGLVLAAVFVVGIMALVSALWPNTNTLTIKKPEGGTVVGAGLECGTDGDTCTVKVRAGETVELQGRADDKYVFSGFTGDCPRNGRISMTQARTCAAEFASSGPGAGPGRTWLLTVTKPEGGTIVAAGGIFCGTNGASCTLTLPDGAPVTLQAERDPGFQFLSFTGDCALGGETVMTAARTCGATFAKVEGAQAQSPTGPSIDPPRPPLPSGPRTPRPTAEHATSSKPAVVNPPPPQPDKPASQPQPPTAPATVVDPTIVKPPTTVDNKATGTTPVVTEEEHAKREIKDLVNRYCSALSTMKPEVIQKVFPLVQLGSLKEQFRQYKSLKCTVTSEPEYDRIDVKGAGGAQLKFGMKQAMVINVGGQPATAETIVTMVVSRRDANEPWHIDRVTHEPKPK